MVMFFNQVLNDAELTAIKAKYDALLEVKVSTKKSEKFECEGIIQEDCTFLENSRNDIVFLLTEVHRLRNMAITKVNTALPKSIKLDYKRLDEIRIRCEQATNGPWISYVEGRDFTSGSSFIETGRKNGEYGNADTSGMHPEEQDFLALSRMYVPLLLGELRRISYYVNTYILGTD